MQKFLLKAIWQYRDLHTAFPYALSALEGLDYRLPRMGDYVARARELAAYLTSLGFVAVPNVPHVNAFQIKLPGTPNDLTKANRAFAQRQNIWLFNGFKADTSAQAIAEIVIGDAAMSLTNAEIGEWITEMVRS